MEDDLNEIRIQELEEENELLRDIIQDTGCDPDELLEIKRSS